MNNVGTALKTCLLLLVGLKNIVFKMSSTHSDAVFRIHYTISQMSSIAVLHPNLTSVSFLWITKVEVLNIRRIAKTFR